MQVRDHDFPDRDEKHAIPYGIYDEQANAGFVNVGTDGNTAALAVESIRRWWNLAGKDAYPDAARLLVTADAGAPTAPRPGLEGRARGAGAGDRAGDHRLPFPARHLQVEQDRAPAVLPDQPGLARPAADQLRRHHQHHRRRHHRHRAERPRRPRRELLSAGLKISDEQMKGIEARCLARHEFHGEWNYALLPVPRPAPDRAGPPAAPRGPDLHALADPAITGMSRAGSAPRRQPGNPPGRRPRAAPLHQPRRPPPPRPRPAPGSPSARLLAAICRYRLGMTSASRRPLRHRPLRHQHRHPPRSPPSPKPPQSSRPAKPTLHQMTR